MTLSENKKQEIKKELNSKLYEMMPEGIEGEIGVGDFRTEFHRIWVDGDGWMMGGKAIYVVMEVMGKLIKVHKSLDSYNKSWMMKYTSGGSGRLDLNKDEIFGHKVRAAKITRKHRENGTLESSMR